MFTASEIAVAFNSVNERKQWEAKPNSRPESGLDVVNFKHKTGLINLTYNASDMRFSVKFNKVQAQWGDYILSIVRGLHHILTTLKKAGLPFEAPATPNGMQITATYGGDGNVYVSAIGDHHPIMPELRQIDTAFRPLDDLGNLLK